MPTETGSERSPTAADVAVAGLLHDDRILLVRTRRLPGDWQPPGGKIESSDPSPIAALLRELREEIGLHLDATKLREFTAEPSDVDLGRVHFFVASLSAEVKLHVRQDEILECRWWRLDEALELPVQPATKQFLQLLTQSRS